MSNSQDQSKKSENKAEFKTRWNAEEEVLLDEKFLLMQERKNATTEQSKKEVNDRIEVYFDKYRTWENAIMKEYWELEMQENETIEMQLERKKAIEKFRETQKKFGMMRQEDCEEMCNCAGEPEKKEAPLNEKGQEAANLYTEYVEGEKQIDRRMTELLQEKKNAKTDEEMEKVERKIKKYIIECNEWEDEMMGGGE